MTLQSNVRVTIAYAEESAFGVAASTAGRLIRRVKSNLGTKKESFQSNEIRPDQQVYDMRHGMRKAEGSVEGELSLLTWDDWFAGLLRSTWATGVSKTQAQLGDVTAGASLSKFVFANSAALEGFRVGDVLRFTAGMPASILNKNYRITNISTDGKNVFTYPAPGETVSTPVTTYAVKVYGKKILCGQTQRSYTIEQRYPDVDMSELFTGCRIGSCAISIKPNGMVTVNWGILGKDGNLLSGANSPYFAAPDAAYATGIFAGVNGSMRLGIPGVAESEAAIVTSVDMTIDNGLQSEGVIGASTAPDVFYGPLTVKGSMSVYLSDRTVFDAFLLEQDMTLVIQLDLPGGVAGSADDFIVFKLPRIKLSDATKDVAAEGGVIVTYPFQALITPTDNLARDEATIAIQRSVASIDT